MKLAGQVALVTGASSGIGRATALALAREGADVALNYYSLPEAAEEAAAQIRALGRRALLLPVDVTDQGAVEDMAARVVGELGDLTIYVASAVYSDREPFLSADLAGFRKTLDVTMWGAFYGLRACARHMVGRGRGGNCVVVTSGQAQIAIPHSMAYNMAKAAVEQMARTAALELAPHRVRVNLIAPGWTDTPGERKFFREETIHQAGAKLPWGRLARAEEIARGVVFLVDPASDYITGSTLSINGGSLLPWWSRRDKGEF